MILFFQWFFLGNAKQERIKIPSLPPRKPIWDMLQSILAG